MEKIVVKKTYEVSADEWTQITQGFNKEFERDKKAEEFRKYYSSNIFGYSYHAIFRNDEGRVCAHSSVIPINYTVDGQQCKFGQGGTSFVLKEYRQDIFLFADLYNALKVYCAKDEVKLIYGVSNKNSFRYAIVIAKSTYLKDLNYYILPVSISKILKKKQFGFLDVIWRIPLFGLLALNRMASYIVNSREKEWPVKILMTEDFLTKRIDDKYKKFKGRQSEGIYRMYDEEGIKTAYIIEFRQKNKRTCQALVSLVIHILRNERADAILFIGDLQLRQFLLFKVPSKKVPQRFPITIDYLDKDNEEMKKTVLSPHNWDFSLINFDVR
jgi:hypothetical protein